MSSPQHSRPQKLQKKVDEPGRHSTCPAEPNISGEKSGSHQNFLTYGQWAKKRCFVGKMFLAELLTPHSICSAEKNFETKGFFSKKICLTFFSAFEWRNSGFVAEVFNKGVKNKIHVTRGTFFGKTLFGGRYNLMSFDGCSEENLICKKTQGSSVRHSTRPVEHSKGRNSGRNKTFLTFGHWARMFWVSGTTKLAELLKLHPIWPEQLLEYIELFFKKNAILILFPNFSEIFPKS